MNLRKAAGLALVAFPSNAADVVHTIASGIGSFATALAGGNR